MSRKLSIAVAKIGREFLDAAALDARPTGQKSVILCPIVFSLFVAYLIGDEYSDIVENSA
jgi:hypothetical protein